MLGPPIFLHFFVLNFKDLRLGIFLKVEVFGLSEGEEKEDLAEVDPHHPLGKTNGVPAAAAPCGRPVPPGPPGDGAW